MDERQAFSAPRIGAVIFDMDGLMLDTERVARIAWDRAMADWGRTIPDEIYQRLIGRTVSDVRRILLEGISADLPFDEMVERKQRYVDEEIAGHGIPVKPGLLDLLDWLDRTKLKRAVASSTFRERALQKLELVGLAGRFDVIVGGDEIRRGKPAPDIFLAAANKLGVKYGECVVLEDSGPGIEAARAAGMIPVMVPDGQPPSPEVAQMAYRVCPSLYDVHRLLEQIVDS